MRIVRPGLAIAVLAAALGAGSTATAAIDPSASAVLAGSLKPAMQTTLKKKVPGIRITKVTCFVPRESKLVSGPCTARFTVAKYNLAGIYRAKATLDAKSRLRWSTSEASCTDSRTHQRASCSNETSTGGGLISARDAETQLLTNGLSYRGRKMAAKSAVCLGLKSHKWLHGKFDDAFSRLRCDTRTARGQSYRLVLVMVNAQTYKLTNVVKRS
jgi:hypothetical protein